jgi:hypothetical protein
MSIIENFAALSAQEQKEFAEVFVKTINTENTFTDITDFKVAGVEADEMTGGLIISLEPEDYIEISREATWTCADREEVYLFEDPDYSESAYEAAKSSFKTFVVKNIDGYYASLEIDDVEEEDTGLCGEYSLGAYLSHFGGKHFSAAIKEQSSIIDLTVKELFIKLYFNSAIGGFYNVGKGISQE